MVEGLLGGRQENASPEYQSIHSKVLVPAILINGNLIIESLDILLELDQRFDTKSLGGNSPKEKEHIRTTTKRANEANPSLKLLTFEFLFRHLPTPSKTASTQFQRLHKNESLEQFHKDFENGFTRQGISDAVKHSHVDFKYLNTVLSDGRIYLCGDTFILGDIAWMPNCHRYDLINWPFENMHIYIGSSSIRAGATAIRKD